MSEKNIKSYTIEQIRGMKGLTNWEKLNSAPDFEGPDEEDFEVDWSSAVMVENFLKTPISLRLDPDVLEFFKADGPGYQTRINAVLRSYMLARKAAKQP